MQSTYENETFRVEHQEDPVKLKEERETTEEKFGAASAKKQDLVSQLEVKLTKMAQVKDHRTHVGQEEDRGMLQHEDYQVQQGQIHGRRFKLQGVKGRDL